MEIQAKMIIMSHLSDIEIEMDFDRVRARQRIGFVKFIIMLTNGDLSLKLDPEKVWNDYIK